MKIHSKTKSQMENKDLFYGNLSYIQNIEAKGLIPAYNPIIKKFTSDNYIFPDDSTSIREIEYLKTKSDDTIFDFSGINPYFISELRDGVYQFESGHDITERICEELSDMLQDYQEVRSYA